jgi:lactoylglutathione lyase
MPAGVPANMSASLRGIFRLGAGIHRQDAGEIDRLLDQVDVAVERRLSLRLYWAAMPDVPLRPLFVKIDCLRLPVRDLDEALAFYRDKLGQALIWRTATAAGLRLPDSNAELVLQTERPQVETDLAVASVEAAVERFVDAGGRVLAGPFDIHIGKCAVVADPFGNVLVILDVSKGLLATDAEGWVVGNETPD